MSTLTNLIPDVYAALDVVSREQVGVLPGVMRDPKADRVAEGQNIRISQAGSNTTSTYTPAMAVPSAAARTVGNATLTMSKSKYSAFSFSGEEQGGLDTGPGFLTVKQGEIAQSIRALVNEMENDLCDALAAGASRAYGTAGTTPFASTLGDAAQIKKILDDNGAPASGRSLAINTSAGAALRTLGQLTKANEAGSSMTLRDGELLNLHGFSVRESAQINNATAGTGASYLINEAGGYAIGDTALTLDTGSGTILAGDIITIGAHKYVVASALAANVVTIAAPGLQAAVADNATVTVNATSARNLAFSSDSILLATRLPVMPEEGDLAIDNEIIVDPRTGIRFDLRVYPGDGMVLYRLHAVWGFKVLKPAHAAILLG